MKTKQNILLLLAIILLSVSCKDKYIEIFTSNSPIYMSYEDLRKSVKLTDATDLVNPGKLYFKDGYIFINEEMKGIHIIDNRNPSDPKNIGFIEVPGNVDMAIKNDILYADSYIDLIAIDISNIGNPKEVKRIEEVFPYTLPPLEDEDFRMAEIDKEKGVVTGWEIKKIRQEIEHTYYPFYYFANKTEGFSALDGAIGGPVANGSTFGIGGSMARFGLYNDYLYTVDQSTLHIFDVKNADSPNDIGSRAVGWNIETLFMYDGHMFLGTRTGMQIFDLDVPTVPNYIGRFNHATSCDPVVISDGYAYVTLRGGNACGSNINRLDVVKFANDYKERTLIASYPLHGPYGLGIDDEILFVCDGDAGLKIYNVEDKLHIDDNMIASFSNINTYDVIPLNDVLFMIGDDGFYQYDYSDLQDIKQLSFIRVKKDE
ncbi:MAG: hypothetical protein CSA36_01905 [Draconibacterium sp.]|nr:MAG: hypothetical protein CSA36_01905 [Draconibacterium sp.]